MKLSITKFSIEHLVAMGCTDIIVDGIKELEAEIAALKAEVDKLTTKKPALFTWTDKTFIDKVEFDKLQAENERLKDELGLMHQMFEKHLSPEIRKAIVKAAKGVQS